MFWVVGFLVVLFCFPGRKIAVVFVLLDAHHKGIQLVDVIEAVTHTSLTSLLSILFVHDYDNVTWDFFFFFYPFGINFLYPTSNWFRAKLMLAPCDSPSKVILSLI